MRKEKYKGKNDTVNAGRKLPGGAIAILAAGFLCSILPGSREVNWFRMEGMSVTALAESADEEDGLLIEDEGDIVVNQEGADLEELKAAEQTEAAPQQEEEEPELFLEPADSGRLAEHLDYLLQMDSPIGSDGEMIMAEYIEGVMEQYGYAVSEQNFHEGFLNENGVDAPGINVIGERGADSENRTNDIFIISAHYDSKTNGTSEDPFYNDKSGVAVLLEMARILSYEETDTDICFLFLSGEEDGLYGSARFVDFIEEAYGHRVAGVLHVELVGYDPDSPYLLKTADGQENYLGNLVRETAQSLLLVEADGQQDTYGGEADLDTAALNERAEEGDGEAGGLGKREDWLYVEDQDSSQYSFAQAGIPSVTVSQDAEEISGKGGAVGKADMQEETEMQSSEPLKRIGINVDKLADITDILAESVSHIMSEETGSLLG